MKQRTVVSIVYVAAMFINIMDVTIVNVALPTLSDDFGVPVSSIEWVVTGYLLSLAVWIPASGWLGDRFGTKRVFMFALAVFTSSSALCAAAQSVHQLVAFRVLQGVGGGMLTPVGLAMLYRAYPPERRAAASKVLIIPTALAPASGPVIGGLLIHQLSWRWIFLVNVPIGVAVFVFGAVRLADHREGSAKGFDIAGFLLAGTGLTGVIYALSQGPTRGWSSSNALVAAAVGLVALVALVRVELRSERPMLQVRLFGDRLFRATNLVSVFATAAFLGTLFAVPVMLQTARGADALESGLTTFPEALGVLSVSQLAARLYPVVGPRRLCTFGLSAMAVMLVLISRVDADSSLWVVRIAMYCLGGSYSFMLISLQASSFAGISAADTGRASALYNMQRQFSAALGVAVLASALAAFLPSGTPSTGDLFDAFHSVFLVAAGIAVTGALVAQLIPDEEAAATMVRRRPAPATVD